MRESAAHRSDQESSRRRCCCTRRTRLIDAGRATKVGQHNTSDNASTSTNQAPQLADEIDRLTDDGVPRDQWPEYLQEYARGVASEQRRRQRARLEESERREAEDRRVRQQLEDDMLIDEPEEQQQDEQRERRARQKAANHNIDKCNDTKRKPYRPT